MVVAEKMLNSDRKTSYKSRGKQNMVMTVEQIEAEKEKAKTILGLSNQINAAIELYLPAEIGVGDEEKENAKERQEVLDTVEEVKALFKESKYKQVEQEKIDASQHKAGINTFLFSELINYLNDNEFKLFVSEKNKSKYSDKENQLIREAAINNLLTREAILGHAENSENSNPSDSQEVISHLETQVTQPTPLSFPQEEKKKNDTVLKETKSPIDLSLFEAKKEKVINTQDVLTDLSDSAPVSFEEPNENTEKTDNYENREMSAGHIPKFGSLGAVSPDSGDANNEYTKANAGNTPGLELNSVSLTLDTFILVADAMIMSGSMVMAMIAVAAIIELMNAMVMLAMRDKMATYACLFFNQHLQNQNQNQKANEAQLEPYNRGVSI